MCFVSVIFRVGTEGAGEFGVAFNALKAAASSSYLSVMYLVEASDCVTKNRFFQ